MNRYSHIHATCQDGSLTWTLQKEEGGFTWFSKVPYGQKLLSPTEKEILALTKKQFSLSTEEDKLVKVTIVETKK